MKNYNWATNLLIFELRKDKNYKLGNKFVDFEFRNIKILIGQQVEFSVVQRLSNIISPLKQSRKQSQPVKFTV